ncbi:MAG TPA: alpha/beta hydrolase [Rhizomicrobium sp.]
MNADRAAREFVSVGEGAVSYLEWRTSRSRLLVFVHATGFNAETYTGLLAPLQAQFRVLACDLRGHGFTTLRGRPGLAQGWSVFRDDLLELVARLDPRPLVLAGHSLGATVSLMAAAAEPLLVRSLFLVEPVLIPGVAGDLHKPASGLEQKAAQRRSVFPSFEAALDAYRGRGIFTSWPDSAIRDYLAGGLIEAGDGTFRLACEPVWEAEIFRESPAGVAHIARGITCPLTILHGTNASTAPPSELATVQDLKPDARVVAVDGGGHFLPIERPELVREEVLAATAGI